MKDHVKREEGPEQDITAYFACDGMAPLYKTSKKLACVANASAISR